MPVAPRSSIRIFAGSAIRVTVPTASSPSSSEMVDPGQAIPSARGQGKTEVPSKPRIVPSAGVDPHLPEFHHFRRRSFDPWRPPEVERVRTQAEAAPVRVQVKQCRHGRRGKLHVEFEFTLFDSGA